jgi:hypothetical protein
MLRFGSSERSRGDWLSSGLGMGPILAGRPLVSAPIGLRPSVDNFCYVPTREHRPLVSRNTGSWGRFHPPSAYECTSLIS